jgi:hypothetical protein
MTRERSFEAKEDRATIPEMLKTAVGKPSTLMISLISPGWAIEAGG